MKKLLLLWLFSCSLDSFSQTQDTLHAKMLLGNDTLPVITFTGKLAAYQVDTTTFSADTIPVMFQVSSNKPMRVVYGIPGYVVYQFGTFPAFLNRKRKPLDPRFIVWKYIGREEPKGRVKR